MAEADVGLIGLAVMGRNLVLNMDDRGYKTAVYNRTTARTEEFLAGPARGTGVIGASSMEELAASLRRPRRIMIMVKAGRAVDDTIERLALLLDEGDILIDGGNSHFEDTTRRVRALREQGLLFVGAGISGGEEGARRGPSIMPGGEEAAWPQVRGVLRDIAAKAKDGTPCCDWVGPDGSGHYTKMVHNGIEYGDMQVIAEAYHLMRVGLGMTYPEMAEVFREWNAGLLDSYLIDITADILAHADEQGGPTLEKILDVAGQKGTGKWAVLSSLDLGRPMTLVAEAVHSRVVSGMRRHRLEAAEALGAKAGRLTGVGEDFAGAVHDALYASKIVSYAQGFMLLKGAAVEYGWDLDYGRIARLWREGCIIRADFLDDIAAAFDRRPDLLSLLLDEFFVDALGRAEAGWRRVVTAAVGIGIPVPAYSSALAFYDAYRSERLPTNLIQAQRDYFGAHTYERVDRPRGEFHHTDWTSAGGGGPASGIHQA